MRFYAGGDATWDETVPPGMMTFDWLGQCNPGSAITQYFTNLQTNYIISYMLWTIKS